MTELASGVRVSFTVFTTADSDEMARLLSDAFVSHDPPAVAAGLTSSEFDVFVRLFCPKAASEGLTIVARSVDTGEMMGALLAEDSASTPPEGISQLSTKFDPIFDILGQLESAYRGGREVNSGESLHLFLLGVRERFGGRGLAHQLVAECVANGARKGYRVAVAEATNRTSQHIFRKLEFVERARASYAAHRFESRAVFASIASHGGPILMDRLLRPVS